MTAPVALSVHDIHTYYGSSHILQGASFDIRDGSIVALLGRNGVGKTTTLQSLLGLPPPRAGTIVFRDRTISDLPTHDIIRAGIAWVPQGHRIFPTLTIEENLVLAARYRREGPWTLERIYEQFPWMRDRRDARGSYLSGGEQQMLAIARALIQNPSLILMDEPSEGLSPRIVGEIAGIVRRLAAEGVTIFMVEQNLQFALATADRLMVMSKGRIVYEADPEEVRSDPALCQQYLGVTAGPRPVHGSEERP